MSTHHQLDIHPEPDKTPLFINEVHFADPWQGAYGLTDEWKKDDNVRVYVPLDLNKSAILRRLSYIEDCYGYLDESTESNYCSAYYLILAQLEIYDQVWRIREGVWADTPGETLHSQHARDLVAEILEILVDWANNACSECFPYEEIHELQKEYGLPLSEF